MSNEFSTLHIAFCEWVFEQNSEDTIDHGSWDRCAVGVFAAFTETSPTLVAYDLHEDLHEALNEPDAYIYGEWDNFETFGNVKQFIEDNDL